MISVIVPTYNRPGPLHRALRSLARQQLNHFDVIVVNDGGSPIGHITHRWRSNLRITQFDTEHRGVSHARKYGLACATGEFVAFLDDDDIVLPHHLHLAHQGLGEARCRRGAEPGRPVPTVRAIARQWILRQATAGKPANPLT